MIFHGWPCRRTLSGIRWPLLIALKGALVRITKKIAFSALATALVAGLMIAQPAKAATDLTIGTVLDIDKLDPHTSTNFETIRDLGLVYGSLVEVGSGNVIHPGLASSWVFSNGGKTLTLKLRSGVKFHDGTTFDAADVKASLERILNTATGAVARSNVSTIASIATPTPSQVVLTLSVPNVPILAALDGVNVAMVSADDIAAGKVGGTNKPNGTGPCKFVSWTAGQQVKLTANTSYWKGAPSIPNITIRVIPNEASILAALNAGTIQFAAITDPLIIKQVGKNLNVIKTPALQYYALQFNTKVAPLNDVNVRLAIQCAIDRNEFVTTALLGQGAISGPITSPAFKSDTSARPCPTVDLAKSKAYLAAAGKTSLSFKVLVTSNGWATSQAMAQNLKAQLAKANITMELDITDQATYVPRWLAADFVATLANNGGRIDPDTMYTRYFTSTGNLNKVATYSSATLDANFLLGKSSGLKSVRTKAYEGITKELEDNAVWVWLATPFEYRVASKNLRNFTLLATGSYLPLRDAKLG